jgi:hypothetical protein
MRESRIALRSMRATLAVIIKLRKSETSDFRRSIRATLARYVESAVRRVSCHFQRGNSIDPFPKLLLGPLQIDALL